jgi:protein-disulfide isomerase
LPFVHRALLVALFSSTIFGLGAWTGFAATTTAGSPDQETAALVAKPVSLPDMVLGSASAPITVVEYSSLTCPHCAAFAENVFTMLQSKYIETGKVRFVSREFPLDVKAAAASMLARCAAREDAAKFFEATLMLFRLQQELIERTTDTLTMVGAKFGMTVAEVEACVKDDATLDKLQADQNVAFNQLKVQATPTFFINGAKSEGAMSFEELEAKLIPLLKH